MRSGVDLCRDISVSAAAAAAAGAPACLLDV